MKLTTIFGDKLLPMMEFVGWLKDQPYKYDSGINLVIETRGRFNKVLDAHQILSQPLDIHWFVRREEPKEEDYVSSMKYESDWHEWENWQSMFSNWKELSDKVKRDISIATGANSASSEEGQVMFYPDGRIGLFKNPPDKGIKELYYGDSLSLNDFAAYCFKNGIELMLNDEYESN